MSMVLWSHFGLNVRRMSETGDTLPFPTVAWNGRDARISEPGEASEVARTMRCDGEPVRPGMRTTRRMSRASQPDDQNGTLSADTIRASGLVRPHHVRPDTRLHPTKTQKTSSQPLQCGSHPHKTFAP